MRLGLQGYKDIIVSSPEMLKLSGQYFPLLRNIAAISSIR